MKRAIDYHDFCTIDTPSADREKWHVGPLWINSIRCNKCGHTVRSRNRRDFRHCGCGQSWVDGGSWYGRAGGDCTYIAVKFNDEKD